MAELPGVLATSTGDLDEQLEAVARLRRFADVLKFEEDFERACRDTLHDPIGRAALTLAYQQAQLDGEARGGVRCCGTADEVHNPWCGYEPRRRRTEGAVQENADAAD